MRLRNIHYQLAFFALCETASGPPPIYPIYRKIEDVPTLHERLTMLVRGTRSYEAEDGLYSGFDYVDEREQIEVIVDVDAAGTATVDFLINGERWHPGSRASTSWQYRSFVDPLEATVFSEPTVSGLNRSTLCWGESDCTGITTRAMWEGMLFVNSGVLCGPEEYVSSEWGCSIRDENPYNATVVGVTSDDVLNMRSGPGVAYFTVGALEPGATVEVLDNHRRTRDGAIWRLVRVGGEIGWVNSSYLINSVALSDDRTAEEELADAFVEFASRPADDAFAALPLADTVALGLGPDIVTVVPAVALRAADAWELDVEYFRDFVGPFSPLQQLRYTGSYQVSVGPHSHCAGPPMPPPEAYSELTRVSIQPTDASIDSCLMWSTVDFFVTTDGTVAAITYDTFGP